MHHGMAALAPRRSKLPRAEVCRKSVLRDFVRKYAGVDPRVGIPAEFLLRMTIANRHPGPNVAKRGRQPLFFPAIEPKTATTQTRRKIRHADVPDETGKDERRVNYQATRPAGRRLDRRSSFFPLFAQQRHVVEVAFDAAFGRLLEFGGVDRDRCDMFVTGHDRIQLFEVVLHDLRKVVLVDPFALGLLVVGHDQCVEFAVVFQHERFQHEVHVVEFVLDLLG